ALIAAAKLPGKIKAVVSRGGRVDLGGGSIPNVKAPTLMIVGGDDTPVIEMNKAAQKEMRCENKLVIIPGASHLFEEPGALDKVSELARDWFLEKL
ncbi:MAG: dienelactone hydrolase family protein, partial [Candidatus Nanoarchaeia archaeon]